MPNMGTPTVPIAVGNVEVSSTPRDDGAPHVALNAAVFTESAITYGPPLHIALPLVRTEDDHPNEAWNVVVAGATNSQPGPIMSLASDSNYTLFFIPLSSVFPHPHPAPIYGMTVSQSGLNLTIVHPPTLLVHHANNIYMPAPHADGKATLAWSDLAIGHPMVVGMNRNLAMGSPVDLSSYGDFVIKNGSFNTGDYGLLWMGGSDLTFNRVLLYHLNTDLSITILHSLARGEFGTLDQGFGPFDVVPRNGDVMLSDTQAISQVSSVDPDPIHAATDAGIFGVSVITRTGDIIVAGVIFQGGDATLGSVIRLDDTHFVSQNGLRTYTGSVTGDIVSITSGPILVAGDTLQGIVVEASVSPDRLYFSGNRSNPIDPQNYLFEYDPVLGVGGKVGGFPFTILPGYFGLNFGNNKMSTPGEGLLFQGSSATTEPRGASAVAAGPIHVDETNIVEPIRTGSTQVSSR